MHEVAIFVVPGTLVLLELFAGAEFLTNAEHAGEDALRRDFQVSSQEGMPVKEVHGSALKAENVVDRGDHQVKVLGPIYETAGRRFALVTMTRINEVSEGPESGFCVRRSVYIKHPKQGFRLVRVGEIRVIEHHKDLKDGAEVGADGVFDSGDRDGGG